MTPLPVDGSEMVLGSVILLLVPPLVVSWSVAWLLRHDRVRAAAERAPEPGPRSAAPPVLRAERADTIAPAPSRRAPRLAPASDAAALVEPAAVGAE